MEFDEQPLPIFSTSLFCDGKKNFPSLHLCRCLHMASVFLPNLRIRFPFDVKRQGWCSIISCDDRKIGALDTTVILRNKQSNYCDGVGRAFDRAKKVTTYSVTTQLMVLMLCLYLQRTKNGRGRSSAYRRVLAMVACKAHNLEVGSSSLPSATRAVCRLYRSVNNLMRNEETGWNIQLQLYVP